MKVIHITPAYKPAYIYGGPTISVALLCEALATTNIDLLVMTTKANGKTDLRISTKKPVNIDGVSTHYFKRITKDHTHFSPALLWNLYKMLSQQKNSMLHIHSWWNPVAIGACFIAVIKNIPVVLSPRGMLTSYTLKNRNNFVKYLIHQSIGRKLASYCHIHATTEKEKHDILKIIKPKSISVIANLIELHPQYTSGIKKHSINNNQPFNLLFLSRIEEKKGLDLLFKALKIISFKWKLTIAGTGERRYIAYLKKLSLLLGISSSIIWIGQVKPDDKYHIFSQHDLLVLLSHNENFANVVLESLITGTPVLISDQVGLADYVTLHDLGWVSKLNIAAIAQTLTDAWQNKEKRMKIHQDAPHLIAHFNKQHLLKQYLDLYQNSK